MLHKKRFFIYGNGKQKRAFSYIDDVAPYIAKSGLLKKTDAEIINIGPKHVHTINYIASLILSHFINDPNHIPKKLQPKYFPDRPQEVKYAYCTDDKAKYLLGFEQSVALKDGIARMIKWAKDLGPQQFKYMDNLELVSKNMPKTWKKHLI